MSLLNETETEKQVKTSGGGIAGSGIAGLLVSVLLGLLSVSAEFAIANEVTPKKELTPQEIERARGYFTDTEMLTQDGERVRFYSDLLDGRVVAVNVIYTSCKGACPMITQKLVAVRRELGNLFGEQVQFVSITNDPERDSPEVLADFARKQGVEPGGWTFVTGPKADIDRVIGKIGLYTPQFEQHKSMILIGNTRTGHWQKIPPHLPPQSVAIKLRELVSEG